MRRSASARDRRSSELPVPLNSSKITSSIRLSVSMSAVAITLREPPSGTARADPNRPLGLASAFASRPPDMVRPLPRPVVLCERARRVRSEEHTSELQSHSDLVCRLLLEKKKISLHIIKTYLTSDDLSCGIRL